MSMFPFNTCEKVSEGIAQPYSVLFNAINCVIVVYYLLKCKNTYTFFFLLSILLFELFHVFSHAFHISGVIQTNIAHILTYAINISFFFLLQKHTRFPISTLYMGYLFLLVCFDLYSIYNLSIVYYILSQSLIFISLMTYYFPLLPKFIQRSVFHIVYTIIAILMLVINEKYNCERMMSFNPHFPYHLFIEIAGIVLFHIICSNFYKL